MGFRKDLGPRFSRRIPSGKLAVVWAVGGGILCLTIIVGALVMMSRGMGPKRVHPVDKNAQADRLEQRVAELERKLAEISQRSATEAAETQKQAAASPVAKGPQGKKGISPAGTQPSPAPDTWHCATQPVWPERSRKYKTSGRRRRSPGGAPAWNVGRSLQVSGGCQRDDDLGIGGMRTWTPREGSPFEAELRYFDIGTIVFHRKAGVVYVTDEPYGINDERYGRLSKTDKTRLDAILKANGVHDLQKAAIEARGQPPPLTYPIAVFSYKADNAIREYPIQLLIGEDYTPLLLRYREWYKHHASGKAGP